MTGLWETVRRRGWTLLWSSAMGEMREVCDGAWLALRLWSGADGTEPEGRLDPPWAESFSKTSSQALIGRSERTEAPFMRRCLISAAKLAPRVRRSCFISSFFTDSSVEKVSQIFSS